MEALVAYYRKYESAVPSFDAVVTLGAEELAREQFRGRSTERPAKEVPMAQVLAKAQPGTTQPLTFAKEGSGTLFYTARFRYAADASVPGRTGHRLPHRSARTRRTSRTARVRRRRAIKAGDLIRVTLTFQLTKERRFVAVTDPLPAGFEPVESWFATTARRRWAAQQDDQGDGEQRLDSLVAARRLRSRRAPRRPRPALRDAAQRRTPRVQLHRPRDDRRDVPHRAGARGGDVRAGGLRAHGDERDRGQEVGSDQ